MDTCNHSLALLPPEVLYLVVESLSRNDQCVAALVCKLWNQIATVFIWSSPSDYVPVKALWTLLFEAEPEYTNANVLALPVNHEELLSKNWDTLLERAKLIKSILIDCPLDAKLCGLLNGGLANQGVQFLCPSVIHVYVSDIHRTVDTCVLVRGESVRRLILELNSADGSEKTLTGLQILPQENFPLEELKIKSKHRYPSVWDALRCAILFPQLLAPHYVGPLFMNSWRSLSVACPRLQSIILDDNYDDGDSETVYSAINPMAVFPSLQYLDITRCSTPSRLAFSLASYMPQLVGLYTGITETPNVQDNVQVARHYQSHSPSMKALQIHMASLQHACNVITDFGSLRELRIWDIDPDRYPTEQDIKVLTEGLPNLVHLQLTITDFSFSLAVHGLTCEAVLKIAEKCKKLESLELAVDARDLKIASPFEYSGPAFTALKRLTLWPITVSEGMENEVAYFFRGMAPMVSES